MIDSARLWFTAPTRIQLAAIAGHLSRVESKIIQLSRDLADARAEIKDLRPDPVTTTHKGQINIGVMDWDQVQALNAQAFESDKNRREAERFMEDSNDLEK